MTSICKCSNNNKRYRRLTQSFINHNNYEIDLVNEEGKGENKNRRTQKDAINGLFEKGPVTMYIEDTKGKFFKGIMQSKFEKNTSAPFYLRPEVIAKARNNEDISKHPFYTCSVAWNRDPLTNDEVQSFKTSWEGKFLGKTLVAL